MIPDLYFLATSKEITKIRDKRVKQKFENSKAMNLGAVQINDNGVEIKIIDTIGYELISKIDLGVHKKFEIGQEEYCFDISFTEDGASLLINANEQMFSEKLCSLLKFGPASTRYKDIFDMVFKLDREKTILSFLFNEKLPILDSLSHLPFIQF